MTDPHDTPRRPSDELDELLGAYVADALDDTERAEVEAHLAASPWARAEVDRMSNAMYHVAAAEVTDMEPRADLWDRIASSLPPRPERAVDAPAPTSPHDELASRRGRRTSRVTRLVLGAAAAVLVVLLGVGLLARDADSPTSTTEQLAGDADRVAGLPGSRTGTLTGADGSVSVRVVIDAEGRGYVLPEGLPPLAADQTYQLWSVDQGTPISLGLLGPNPTVAVVGTGGSPTQLAITAEPATGSTAPTANPIVVGTIA